VEEEMRDDELLVDEREGVLVLTLNRPAARTAVNLALATALADALEQLDSDPALHVGVLTGAAGTFCAGMDLKAFAKGEVPVVQGRGFAGLVQRPPAKPLLAAVEGYALAGGLEVVLACDLVVAGRGAVFGIPEVRRGLVAAGGGLLRLPRRIPYHAAMELALLGGTVPASQMHAWGLVNRLVDDGQALETAAELARQIAANAPLAVQASKQIVVDSADWSQAQSWPEQEAIAGPVRTSQDAREGAVAFAEKRPPVWQGR
jgi:enoyl-CoA hydratase